MLCHSTICGRAISGTPPAAGASPTTTQPPAKGERRPPARAIEVSSAPLKQR